MYLRVLPVANYHFAVHPHSADHEAKLAVAVRRLVQVHEVHVDAGPRDLTVELRVQVRQRLLERVQSGDPHLGRRERVQPGDQTHAGIVGVGFEAQGADLLGRGDHRLEDYVHRDAGRVVQRLSDLTRVVGDLLEGLLAVEVLTARHEPGFVLLEIGHARSYLAFWP